MVIRDLYLNKLISWVNKPIIKVITGVRRCGKSYLMKMIQEFLLNQDIDEKHMVYINFELLQFSHLQSFDKLHSYIKEKTDESNEMTYVFIDEIQECVGWERVVASLIAEGGYDIYLTGSNASMLSGDLATHIAGRYIEIEVFPLSFSEYCRFAKELNWKEMNREERFNDYIKYGGFPGLANAIDEDEAKIQYLDGIRSTVVLRDAIQRHNIRDAVILEKVLLYVFDNVGQIFSAKKVTDYLKSMGYKASMDSVSSYINVLEDAKIIYSASRYDIKGKKIMQRLDKHFICDLGLRYADIGYRDNDIGQILENVIYMELRSRGYKVYVGKEDKFEVDFIAEKGDIRHYFQVTYLLASEEVKEREYRSLLSIKDAYPKTVLSMDRLPMGNVQGVRHKYILEFLLGEE